MKINNNIWNLRPFRTSEDVPGIHCYLVKDAEGLTLVDTGLAGKTEDIIREIRRQGQDPRELKKILLTHGHADNMGNAAMLQRLTGCIVYASEEEIRVIRGEVPRKNQRAGIPGPDFQLPELTSIPEEGLPEYRIYLTPGHTAGHVCYGYEDVLFTGDACTVKDDRVEDPSPLFCEDAAQAKDSWRSLDIGSYSWICVNHGRNHGYVKVR